MYDMAPTARRILETVLGVKPGERVTIVTDTASPRTITDVLATVAASLEAKPLVLTMLPHRVGGQEPAPAVAAAMKASDVVVLQDAYALVHTDAFRAAMAAGVRLVELWGVTEEMMVQGGLVADYHEVARITDRVEAAFKRSKTARLTTASGTDITVAIGAHPPVPLTGEALYAGSFCSLPGGELAVAPDEGTASGVLVDPFLLEQREMGYRKDPLRVTVEKGVVIDVEGGREAAVLSRLLDEAGEAARNIAEFAVGTNGWCRPFESFREAKKALGTAHVAVGDSGSLGGTVSCPLHMDMIFDDPTVSLDDGVTVLKDGRLVVP